MTLNFPSNTTQPYVDPSSGLKYVFNTGIGAWESAIQPPAIISSYPPTDIRIPGFLYWDREDGNLYVYYEDANGGQWVQASPNPEVPRTFVSNTSPPNPTVGDLWWDTVTGRLFVYYTDIDDSSQWVDASPASLAAQTAAATVSETPPGNPIVGALWWNTTDGNLYIWYEDQDGGEFWINASSALGIGSGGGGGASIQIQANLPLELTGTLSQPILSVRGATTTTIGVVKFASTAETNTATSTAVALTPGGLKAGISNYVPDASVSTKGIVELGTQAEINAGAPDRVVTGETLANFTGLSGVPPGAVVEWFLPDVPAGWVPCDGRLAAPYPNLVALGFTNLPDLRGEFTRGWDAGRGADPGRTLGSFQAQMISQHQHITFGTQLASWGISGWIGDRSQNNVFCVLPFQIVANPTFANGTTSGVTGSGAAVGNETRPRNVSCIKIMKT